MVRALGSLGPPKVERLRGNQDRGATEAARTQIRQRFIRFRERISPRLRFDPRLRSDLQEFQCVAPGEVRDRHQMPLFPEDRYGKLGMSLM